MKSVKNFSYLCYLSDKCPNTRVIEREKNGWQQKQNHETCNTKNKIMPHS